MTERTQASLPSDSRMSGDALLAPGVPLSLTPIIGRDQEVDEISGLLQRPDVRLLVLTGPGGTGKTRLGIEVARRVADAFPDGVRFIPLAPVRDPDGLYPAIAARIGVREGGERSLRDLLLAVLRDRTMLLVLDNFEQIVSAAPLLVEMLSVAPALKILVTSRAVLRVTGEHDFPVAPLSLPDPDQSPEQSDAVRLFEQRARAVRPEFSLDESNLPIVAAICRQLDGLPLAIELAAARLRHLSLASLNERLDQRLSILSDGARDQPARLQTMRNAIAWSYDLLQPEEQRIFRSLSVFTGGFGLSSARFVTETGDDRLFEGITALVDNSLLRQLPDHDGEPRFRMLEVIREFGLEQLEAAGDAFATQDRLAEWCVSLVESGWPEMARRVNQNTWLARYDLEMPKFRVAMSWLAANGDSERYVRLSGGLFWYWYVRGQFSEGRSWLSRALAMPVAENHDRNSRARAIYGEGILSHFQGDDDQAELLVERALEEWGHLGNERGQGISRLLLGIIAEDAGAFERSRELVQQAIQHTENAGDAVNNALATYHLGVIVWGLGDLGAAVRLVTHALERQREIGDRWGEANSLEYLGLFAALRGEFTRSNDFQQESFRLRVEMGTPLETEEIGQYLGGMATLAVRCGQPELAARLFGAEQRIRSSIGSFRRHPERRSFEAASAQAMLELGDDAFQSAWLRGQSGSINEAIDLARAFDPAAGDAASRAEESDSAGRHERLTARELDVLRLLAQGQTNAEIAEQLFITPGTARIHVSNILRKLDAQNRTEAVAIARRSGALPSD